MESRQYLRTLDAALQALEDNPKNIFHWSFSVGDDIAQIYRAVSDRVGILPYAVSEDVIHTYHLLLAAVEDVKTVNQLASKAEDFRRSGYFDGAFQDWDLAKQEAFLNLRNSWETTLQSLEGTGKTFVARAIQTVCDMSHELAISIMSVSNGWAGGLRKSI